MDEDHDQTTEKRCLKKVRRHFLARRADGQEPPSTNSPLDSKMDDKDTFYNFSNEVNKTYFETAFSNPEVNIERIKVEGEGQSMAVTLFLKSNGENMLRPRKELPPQNGAYGDLEFAKWALNFQEFHTVHPDVIDRYFEFLHSADPNTYSNLRKAKRKAVEAYKNIETTYPFRKFMVYSDKETTKMLSCSYSGKLFAELGYMLEPFIEWIKENGFPTLFETDSSVHMDMTTEFLDNMASKGEAFLEGPEYLIYCFDKDGKKVQYLAQFLTVVEPCPDGLFGTFYVILKKRLEISTQDKFNETIGLKEENEFKASGCSDELVQNTFQTLETLGQKNAEKMSAEDL